MCYYPGMTAQDVITQLGLSPLPEEGGYYKETHRDERVIPSGTFADLEGERKASTCIYYLVTPEEFSGLHAVKSVEIFHFYAGDPVEMVQISESRELNKVILGPSLQDDHSLQVIVEKNIWQGTQLLPGGQWALMGCTVAPGFEFQDFSGGTFRDLSEKFPQHKELIRQYTHQ